MNCKNIKFAKEICFNAELNETSLSLDMHKIYEYIVENDDLFLVWYEAGKENSTRLSIRGESDAVIEQLILYKEKGLLRLDELRNGVALFTFMEFADVRSFTNEDPLTIIVDQAASSFFRSIRVEFEDALGYVKKQVLVDEKYAFAYGNMESRKIELLGERYYFELEQTAQGYLHIIGGRQRRNAGNFETQVVLLQGSIKIDDQLTNKSALSEKANEEYRSLVQNNSEFIKLWELYDQTELESIRQDAENMGCLEYKSFKRSGNNLVFEVAGLVDPSFLKEGMFYAAIQRAGFDTSKPMDYNPRSAVTIGSEYDFKCANTPQFIIYDDVDPLKSVPKSGYIVPSLQGSVIQSKRRMTARNRVIKGDCGMPGLKNVIQAGSMVGVSGKKHEPASANLEKAILPKGFHFTELQKRAIDAALNTPDIAIIQGPPGTGKTTVIRAIVKRIDEIENGLAKILISSTQHDAVDNASEGVMYGGVPANRIANRRKDSENNVSMYSWIDDIVSSCEVWLRKNDENNQRSVVREIFEALARLKVIDKDWDAIYKLLNEIYVLCLTIVANEELMKAFSTVLLEVGNICNNEKNDNSALVELLNIQRTENVSFLDDGPANLRKLERYLKFESELEFDIPDYWSQLKMVKEEGAELDKLLEKFKKDIAQIEHLCGADVVVSNEQFIRDDLNKLIEGIQFELIYMGSDKKQQVADLIWGFKQSLTNADGIKQLISGYSKVNAATCQQSANRFLSPTMKGWDEEYDYVIIDEAARSNPLDILIPMSMGKKIILVGDHKQLPHILEPDVVKAVQKTTQMNDAEEILKESLFMRLYNLVKAEDMKTKHKPERTAMLQEQYRMHPDICELVNVFYRDKDGNNGLESMCTAEEKAHKLGMYDNKALAWLDVPANDIFPFEGKGKSKSRPCEVQIIYKELSKIRAKDPDATIGIIAFYSSQVVLLREMVNNNFPTDMKIQVGTVDAFQGKEFDFVLLSTVRSNDEKENRQRVGFLNNENRLCVAFSRARKLLITVGDSKTVANDGTTEYIPALNELVKKCKSEDGYYYECSSL